MASFNNNFFKMIMGKNESATDHRLIGFELEVVRKRNEAGYAEVEMNTIPTGKNNIFAGCGCDGADIELVTHPVSHSLIKEESPLNDAFKYLSDNEFKTNWQSGTHINISKLSKDPDNTYANLLWLQMIYSKQMEKIFGRVSHWARNPISLFNNNSNFKAYKQDRFKNAEYMRKLVDVFVTPETAKFHSERNSKSLLITDKGNRYEFRGAKSTVSKIEAFAWAQFCYNIVEAAAKPTMKNIKFKDFIKGDYIENYFREVVQESDNRKLTTAQLNMPVNYKAKIEISRNSDKLL